MFSMRSLHWEALRIITGAKAGSNSACNMKKRLEKTESRLNPKGHSGLRCLRLSSSVLKMQTANKKDFTNAG